MPPVKFPPGEPVVVDRPFEEGMFAEADKRLAAGECADGWLEVETPGDRLTCLVHDSRPYLAGLTDARGFSWVPLCDFPLRTRQLEGATCRLMRAGPVLVLLMAVHFRNRPVLQAATNLVDLDHVLSELAGQGKDAALALERSGNRTLLFLQNGEPARIFFGDPEKDPGEGSVAERFLLYGFAHDAADGRVEVFDQLTLEHDPDEGKSFTEIARLAKPPPPRVIHVRLGNRKVVQRPFMPPFMTIGREYTCELILDNLSVSRQHARLAWERGQFVLQDLGSANGTQVNGQSITRVALRPGDRFSLGKFDLELAEPSDVRQPQTTMQLGAASGYVLCLVGAGQKVPVTDEVTLGSSRGVDVRVRGLTVQSYHARVKNEGTGTCKLTCLGRAKVRLNGKKVSECVLRSGDELQVGGARFRIVPIPVAD